MKVLISDQLSDRALDVFKKFPEIEVLFDPTLGKDVAKLKIAIADVDAIAIRSATKLTPEILDCAKKLKVIGRAGIGVDNVDIPYASKRGIIVMNTPFGNTITTAEHAVSMMCALTRSIPQASASTKAGKWEKNRFMGAELYNKTLGVVGLGNIGKIVADRALGLKMKVAAYDPFLTPEKAMELGVEKVELDDLFKRADYISVHTPMTDKTRNIINRQAFEKMKRGVFIINCARGGIVNELDLVWAIENKIVAGAALDVFEKEPVDPGHPLLKLEQVICTPHLGASTEEAQENVALDVATQIADFLVNRTVVNALNAASASPEVLQHLAPVVPLCEKIGLLHGQLCEESPRRIQINYYGDITKYATAVLTTEVLKGFFRPMLSDTQVNAVNAPYIAKERGLDVRESKISAHSDYAMLVEVVLEFAASQTVISGTVFGRDKPRIVRFNNIYPELKPAGVVLIVQNRDQPGVVGRIGTFLGQKSVNISHIQLGLDEVSGLATAFYNLDADVSLDVLTGLKELEGIVSVRKVVL